MFTQMAAVVYKMAVSCITTQLIVYKPVDGPSSVREIGMKSLWSIRSLAYWSGMKNRVVGCGVWIYTYPGSTPCVSELLVLTLSSGGECGVPGLSGAGHYGGAPVSLRLQWVCGLFPVQFWWVRHPFVWFFRTIAGCLSIASFTMLSLGNTTPCFFSSLTSARGIMSSCCISSSPARENPSLAMLAISKAWLMLDCSRCTRPPCFAIVADMLETYKKLVAASRVRIGNYLNHIRLRSVL